MKEYGIKNTVNHEVHEERTQSINALNLHALHVLHGYFFYIEYFHSLGSVSRPTELIYYVLLKLTINACNSGLAGVCCV